VRIRSILNRGALYPARAARYKPPPVESSPIRCEPSRRSNVGVLALGALVAVLALGSGCVRSLAPKPRDWSGFLDDYSKLRLGEQGELPFVYRDPDAHWTKYDKVLVEPVALWRSGKHALDPIPEDDLLRLVAHFERAVRSRLGAGFQLVTEPEPGTLRIRLAITEARASDPVVDVLTATPEGDAALAGGSGPIGAELEAFIDAAAIEGEIRDAVSGDLLAEGIDRRRAGAPQRLATWEALDRALAFWADRVCARLEARTRRR
jgi:hypothetical protein